MPWYLDTSQPGGLEVWEDSDDEKISCEKEPPRQVVSADAREILQGGDAVVEVGDGGTPDGGEWKKKRNERARQLHEADKLPQVREGGSNTKWTLSQGVALCSLCFFRGKNGAVPYPVEHEKQIAWWEKQDCDNIENRNRTILMKTSGCPPGTRVFSPAITKMQYRGKTAEAAKKRKREGNESKSKTIMGHTQMNPVEGVAIHLLLVFFRAAFPGFDSVWEVLPVFDGLEADFMMRRKDWKPDVWTPMQMKSVSECVQGKPVTYSLARGDYPNVFCVCVGMLGFVHRTADLTGPNDIANVSGCSIAEIWNIGNCSDIERSLRPTFGVPYSKFAADRRLHFPGANEDAKSTFAESLLRDIEAWPRMGRNRIFYEFGNTINSNVIETYQLEKKGFEVADAALRTHGLCVAPVWRQNETTDYAVASVESGEPLVFVSGKTATVHHNNPNRRYFKLGNAPNKHFCDVVVASYSGAHHTVAVMSRDTVYVAGKKSFRWNEDRLDPGVRVFHDIRIPEVGKAFADYIISFRRV
jgi:hypothetical protein